MTETVVYPGDDAHRLVGILSAPEVRLPRALLVIINAGLLHRAGPHRLPVLLGRKLVSDDFATLRIDRSGIGDSQRRPGSHLAGLRADWAAISDWIEHNYPDVPIVLLGLCSGADEALLVAHEHTNLSGLILLDGYAPRTPAYHVRYWLWRIGRLSAWSRLFERLAGSFGARSSSAGDDDDETDLRDWADESEMMSRFAGLMARQVPVLAVFTGAVIDYYSYQGQLGAALDDPACLSEALFPHCNHLYELTPHRSELIGCLREWLITHVRTHPSTGI